jgi:transposase, IS30 family
MYESYFPETTQAKYEDNRKACGAKLKLDETIEFIKFAETKILDAEWSPDAVCGFADRNSKFDNARVCTKTLYNYIKLGLITVKNIELPLFA